MRFYTNKIVLNKELSDLDKFTLNFVDVLKNI